MSEERLRVLLLDDEESLRHPLKRHLEQQFGYHVDAVATGEEALRQVEESQGRYDVALIDELLTPGPDGIAIMQELKGRYPDVECIIFTGWGSEHRQRALEAGAFRYVEKPFNHEELAMLIRTAAQQVRLRAIGEAILRERDLDHVLQAIARAACSLALADEAAIVLLDKAAGKLRLHATTYVAGQQWQRHFRGQSLSREIIRDGRVVRVPDATQDRRVHRKVIGSGIRSFVGVPIPDEGVLYVYSREPGRFEEWGAVAVLQTLAGQAGLAIANAWAFEEMQRRAHRLETLQELALTINSSMQLDETLQTVCRAAVELFNAEHSGLVVFRPDLAQGEVRAEYPALGTLGAMIPLRGVPAEEWLLQTKQPLVITDVAGEEALGPVRDYLLGHDIQSILIVPVIGRGGALLGSFSLDAVGHARQFSDEEIDLCKVFAAHVAVAVENAQLFKSTSEGRAYIRSLFEASSAIISPTQSSQVLHAIADTACKAPGAWRAVVVLMSHGGGLRVMAQAGFQGQQPPVNIRSGGVTEMAIWEKTPRFYPDTQAFVSELNPCLLQGDARSAACLPLLLGDRAAGALWLEFREPHPFSQTEQQALQVFASQAAIAYDHARRMRELEHLRLAVEKLASLAGVQEVLKQVVASARQVLEADSAVIWSYDDVRHQFLPDEMVADGIEATLVERFRGDEPRAGGTAAEVMERGYIEVTDVDDQSHSFLGPAADGLRGEIGVRAFQGIALRVGEERHGVLYANYACPRSFGAEDRATLETFAYHAALALKRARLREQVELTKQAAAVVAGVSVREDLPTTLKTIAQHVRKLLRADAVSLYSYDAAIGQLGPWAIDIIGQRQPNSACPPDQLTDASVVWTMVGLQEEPYYLSVESGAKDVPPFGRGRFAQAEGIKAVFAVQLRAAEQNVGVMFANYRSPHRFSGDEIATMQLFANQAAVATRNAQLYVEATRRANALQALYEAGKVVTSSLTLQETLDRIAQQALALVGDHWKKGCFSHLALKTGNWLRLTAAWPAEILAQLREQIDSIDLDSSAKIGVTGRVARTGQAENVGDVTRDPDYITLAAPTDSERIHSEMAVPIRTGEQVIGVVNVEHPGYHAFREEDLQALEHLAAQAAIAIQNAWQYENLEETKAAMAARTSLAWVGMVSSVWRHTIDKHALTIREQVILLRSQVQDLPERPRIEERLGTIERLATQILEKPITPPLSAEEGVQSVAINELVQERTSQLWSSEPYRSVSLRRELTLGKQATVRASSDWLRRALDVVVDNAVEATAGQTKREIIVLTREKDRAAEIVIEDNGRGIPPAVRAQLFRGPIEKQKGEKGLGLGLLIAQMIMQQYGGGIWFDPTRPSGTTMVISLPLEA